MKFLIVVLAFVAAAAAQVPYNSGQYNAGQYYPGQYNPQRYNPFRNPYSRYTTPSPFRPFASSTFAPPVYPTFAPVYSTPAPVYSTPAPVAVVPKVNQDARNANIVKYGNEIQPDGSYSYFYETENGIAAQEEGVPRNLGGNPPAIPDVATGSYAYTSPEGVPVSVRYVADETGFHPEGNVIPTSPPVPELIARALDYIAKNSAQRN